MSPFVGLGGTRSFCLLHPLFRIDTEDQPHRHLVAIRQLHNYVRDFPRIPFRTSFEASQYLAERTDRRCPPPTARRPLRRPHRALPAGRASPARRTVPPGVPALPSDALRQLRCRPRPAPPRRCPFPTRFRFP